jgi:hypothetical protein
MSAGLIGPISVVSSGPNGTCQSTTLRGLRKAFGLNLGSCSKTHDLLDTRRRGVPLRVTRASKAQRFSSRLCSSNHDASLSCRQCGGP